MSEDLLYGAFSWDIGKERLNRRKHGLGFYEAVEVFADPQRIVAHDDQHSTQEERLFCLGLVRGRVVTVRFTYRGERIRIFGAGYWRKGRRFYEKTNSQNF